MNVVGPILIWFSFAFNIYTVLIYFVLPYTKFADYERVPSDVDKVIHFVLFALYSVLILMTMWSFMAVKCTDPGFVPRNATAYENGNFPLVERILHWQFEKHSQFG